jgi:hypothetical protein
MTKILALSGKKQSGKTTAANFLFGSAMASIEIDGAPIIDYAHITEQGNLVISGVGPNNTIIPVTFPIESRDPGMRQYMSDTVWPIVKTYSFADALKQKVCIDILGLTFEQCYGSDEDKDSVTSLKWEDMPGVVPKDFCDQWGNTGIDYDLYTHEPGFMTAREVMQYVGSDIFRKMYNDVWIDATFREIQQDQPILAVIIDCRFPNEIFGTQKHGGKALRFTKDPFKGQDQHISETSLDPENFDWKHFDGILDNEEMDIHTQNEAMYNILVDWKYITFSKLATFASGESLLTT